MSAESETEVRIAAAIAARRQLGFMDGAACRLIYGESDGLPGLIVDRYGDFLVCQFLAAAAEFWRDAVIAQLQRRLSPTGIFERSDAAARRKEGLPARQGPVAGAAPPERLELEIGGLRQSFDIAHGQKTGGYLDQQLNRLRVASYAAGTRVLDAYSFTGSFGLQCLLAGASEATLVDSRGSSARS